MTDQNEPTTITPQMLELAASLSKIFMPYAEKQRLDFFKKTPDRSQHNWSTYTTAEAALNIIRTKRFWIKHELHG